MKIFEWELVFLLAALWGTSFFLMELAIPSFTPFTLAMLRIGIAAALLTLILKWRGVSLGKIIARWRLYATMGLLASAFPFVCFAWGQQYIDSSLASVLNALTPLFAFVISVIIGADRFTLGRIAGLALSFVGVAVLVDPDVRALEALGILAGLAAAVSYGVNLNIAFARARHFPPLENACGQLIFATALLLPLSLWEQPWRGEFAAVPVIALLALAIFGTLFAYLVFFRLVSTVGTVNTALSLFFVPVIATALGFYILDEPIGLSFLLGLILILTGVALTDQNTQQALLRILHLARRD